MSDNEGMHSLCWVFAKLHEVVFYGLVSTVVCVCAGILAPTDLFAKTSGLEGFSMFYATYLFWACVLFIPVAFICAMATKYVDHGDGLLFSSSNVAIIVFGHIVEEVLGIVLGPVWLAKDFFTHNLKDFWKVADHILYLCLVSFNVLGVLSLMAALAY